VVGVGVNEDGEDAPTDGGGPEGGGEGVLLFKRGAAGVAPAREAIAGVKPKNKRTEMMKQAEDSHQGSSHTREGSLGVITWEVDPLGVAKLVAHEIEVRLACGRYEAAS
jgi:hypothetical protein